MSRIYVRRTRWWHRRRALLCCNPPCPNYASTEYELYTRSGIYPCCSESCLMEDW